jgi:CheY-like chemotaxis protein
VKDEAIVRHSFAQLLRAQGHVVIEASNGIDALALLDQWHFHLVITDLVMPKLDGFRLVAQIRARWRWTLILLISAYLSEHAGRAISGSAEFMHEPIDPPALIETVQRLLSSR